MAETSALARLRVNAARLCAAVGVSYPKSLLSEGLPHADHHSGDLPGGRQTCHAPTLEEIVTGWVAEHPNRKAVGLFLTPRSVARDLIHDAVANGFEPATVLDPAVGAGVFLEEALRRFGHEISLYGVDRDPFAVASTRLTLWLAAAEMGHPFPEPRPLIERIRLADALLDVGLWRTLAGGRGFDLVCGNPPFGNGIEKRTGRSADERKRLKVLYPEAARGPYDRCVVFTQLGTRLLSRRGRLAFLLPRSVLAARYAAGLRGLMARETPPDRIVLYRGNRPVPDADIAMVGLLARRIQADDTVQVTQPNSRRVERVARSLLTASTWGGLIHPNPELIAKTTAEHPTFDRFFLVRSGAYVAEAYQIVQDLREGGSGWRFLTSGLITRYAHRWGERTARHLNHRFSRPILPNDTARLSDRRRRLYDAPKIIVAGLSSVLRAFADEGSRYAASVGTFLVLPLLKGEAGQRLLRRGTLLLNSVWLSEVHRCRAGPMSLSGGNLPLGRRDLEAFPIPASIADDGPDLAVLDAGFEAMKSGFDPVWDQRIQRGILKLAGCNEAEAETILDLHHRRFSSRGRGPRGAPHR